MRRVASMPFISGMLMSISTSSGRKPVGQLDRLGAAGRFPASSKPSKTAAARP